MDKSKFSYSAFVDSGASTSVKQFMEASLDVAKNAILSSSDIAVSWDSSGIKCRKLAADGSFEPEQIAIINNSICFTDDGWQTAKMAIGKFEDSNAGTSWGVVAPNIVGTLLAGQNLVIESEKKNGGVSAFRVDASGASLHNATFDIYNGAQTQITLNPYSGIAIGSYPLYTGDEYTINESNAKFWVDTDGNVHLKGTLHGVNGTFSGELRAATGTFSGELQAATGRFKGIVQASSFQDLSGREMLTADYKFSPDYLELKGLNVNNNFIVDSNGNVTMRGNISMTGGSIAWGNINETGSAAYQIANNAYSLADGAYYEASAVNQALNALKSGLGYTFINGEYIISPTIIGATIKGGKFYNLSGGAYLEVGGSSYGDLSLWRDGGTRTFRVYDGASHVTFSSIGGNFLVSSAADGGRVSAEGTWNFSGANVIGLDATFG